MMGISAGGNLAALMGIAATAEARPDFLVLGYPTIPKSLANLPATVPPTFVVCADVDRLTAATFAAWPAALHAWLKERMAFPRL